MSALLAIALSNIAVGLGLAALALGVGRWSRRPALTHGVWLLFFVKLLTPPLFTIPVGWSQPKAQVQELPVVQAPVRPDVANDEASDEPGQDDFGVPALNEVQGREPAVAHVPLMLPAAVSTMDFPWLNVLTLVWLVGSLCWFCLAGVRLVRFRRQLRLAQPASAQLRGEAQRLADQLRVTCPGVWIVPGPVAPMLWVLGGTPRLLLPAGLLQRLDQVQRHALLTHELAHWRRRDHWVRWLELAALGLYWWCPLVWWARRHMQEAEEECCDAWVVWLMPGAARGYALALVETMDFLAGARPALPPAASGIGHVQLLKRRLTMIMGGTTPRGLTLGGVLAVLGLGALVLPVVPNWAESTVAAQVGGEQPEKPRQGPGPGDKRDQLAKAQQDIQRMKQELDQARHDLERRARDLEMMLDQFKRASQEVPNPQPKKTPPFRKPGEGGPGGPPPGKAVPGEFGPRPGFEGGPGRPMVDMERRLQDVERKLDMVLHLLTHRGQGPGGPGGPPPGGQPGGQGGFAPRTPPAPPVPPIPPGAPRPPQGQ